MSGVHVLLVGIGGFIGAIARFSVSRQLNEFHTPLPIGTLTVNLSGAFLLGMILGAKADTMIALLFGTGFLGAFTTFSTLKLEMIQLRLSKFKKEFILYVVIIYGGGIALAFLGNLVGRHYF
ncbi:fluoride efflux transporter CrcB [Peribacillus deserti]|uniref:Fluoride-specific ion channel FluC n=1 Tax=Peribacillus deserti TaxID=673318 RepID=A0A2N5LZI5_9BACI|nr:fluoride efflux transporter CrcB [Peribacillus deserti]PLT27522.1 fluoride efflux transporter CrcB [Peribacillus deserti]